ncbi:2-C-methyl-D-erythritol 2,4-cyclodiphosphate synthase [Aminipila terrae]
MPMECRIGTGYDVHRLEKNRKLILGGVEIPFESGLSGHSDADVLVHAIMDALLGAAALGDIGRHFPDADEKYEGISSMKLLEHVSWLLERNGYGIGNIDATIIAQAPRLAPFIDEMKINIAETLKISHNKVNVKATTTEKLGFTGRKEGIASEAVCILNKI